MSIRFICPSCGYSLKADLKPDDDKVISTYSIKKSGGNLCIYISNEVKAILDLHKNDLVEYTIRRVKKDAK